MKPHARHRARALVLQAVFQWQFTGASISDLEQQYLIEVNPKKVDIQYFSELLRGVITNVGTIDELLTPYLDRTIPELDQVERAVLRLAGYELAYRLDVPHKVALNEALELAKKFGSIEGYKYINGVLDKLIHTKIFLKIRPR